MDLYSLFLGFVEFKAPPRELLLDDKLFVDNIWLNFKIELRLKYRRLPWPPESSAVLLCTLGLISKNLVFETVCCGVVHELCMDSGNIFRHQNLSRQGEIWLDNLMQNLQFAIATQCLEELSEVGVLSKIVPASCCVDEFIHLVSMDHEAVIKMLLASEGLIVTYPHTSDLYDGLYVIDVVIQIRQLYASHIAHLLAAQRVVSYLTADPGLVSRYCVFLGDSLVSWKSKQLDVVRRSLDEADVSCELDWLRNLLHDLHVQLVDYTVLFYSNQAAPHIVNSLVSRVPLQQSFPPILVQEQRRYCGFIEHMTVAHSGWFRSILDLLYCSLPRPPEAHCDFISDPCQFIRHSSSPRCKSLPS